MLNKFNFNNSVLKSIGRCWLVQHFSWNV